MGIGIVLLFWAFIATALATLGAVALGGVAFLLTRRVKKWRWMPLTAAVLFPFACVAWAGAVFFFQAFVNTEMLERDAGLGDAWYCPLPNGYAVLMIDQLNWGTVYNPKTQMPNTVVTKDDAVGDVTDLQLAGRYILGRTGARDIADPPQRTSYFLLDTKLGRYRLFAGKNALADTARLLGIQVALEPISTIYFRYRGTWFDGLALALLLVPPGIAGLLGVAWILRLRWRAAAAWFAGLRAGRPWL